MINKSGLITGISGVRGIIDETLDSEIIKKFAMAFAGFLPQNARVILARDTRPSGNFFSKVAERILVEAGCEVYNLGCCPTPTAKLMTCKLQGDGAIIITASHNPAEWNGMKFVRSDGVFLNYSENKTLMDLFHKNTSFQKSGGQVFNISTVDVKNEHISRILAEINLTDLRNTKTTVTVDFCNGTGSIIVKDLFRELGIDAHYINDEPNGYFSHDPEPIPSNLQELGNEVRKNKSDIGFAIDPDADRVTIVDSTGSPVGEDKTLAIAVESFTQQKQGPVVTTLSTSQAVSDIALANKCDVQLTPVGEVHVVEKMLEIDAIIGGEGNGGVILTQISPGRDAATGIILILEAIAKSGRKFEKLLSNLPSYVIEKRKILCDISYIDTVVELFLRQHPKAHIHPIKDGIKIYLESNLNCPWVHLRPSNTEPVVRIISEARNTNQATKICQTMEKMLIKIQ